MLHKLVIKAKVTIHIYENTYIPKSFGKFSSKLGDFNDERCSLAVKTTVRI